jgi:predicted ArsR family transcriptional regulator
MRRPALCSISVNAITRVLGYRVVRDEKFQNGDGRCVFRVLEDQPIDPASWEFRLESELTRT